MAEKRDLLPANATPIERKLALVCADIEDVPLPLRQMRRALTCPADMLTWLAWERSVDRWNENWSEAAKRKAVANSFFVHRHKGTVGALRRVVEPLGYLLEVIEWWQMVPEGPRGTFRLSVGVLDTGITDTMYAELDRLIDDAKRLSQHLTGLSIAAEIRTSIQFGVASYDGDTMTVYPYTPEPIEVALALPFGLCVHTIDTMTVYP